MFDRLCPKPDWKLTFFLNITIECVGRWTRSNNTATMSWNSFSKNIFIFLTYSVDHQWCFGRSIPFCHFSLSIPFYCPKRVRINQNDKRVWINQDVIDGPHCMCYFLEIISTSSFSPTPLFIEKNILQQ
jgi:hypothetical protein